MGRHNGEVNHKCEICGKCFNLKHNLKRHLICHDKIKIEFDDPEVILHLGSSKRGTNIDVKVKDIIPYDLIK
jgi:uncharacterized Zn-finger protein